MTTGGRKCRRHLWAANPYEFHYSKLGRVRLHIFCWNCGKTKFAWYYIGATARGRGPKGRAARKMAR